MTLESLRQSVAKSLPWAVGEDTEWMFITPEFYTEVTKHLSTFPGSSTPKEPYWLVTGYYGCIARVSLEGSVKELG